MTDKQIMIDGVDVSGCIYYEDGKCLNGEMVQCNCKKVAVCYYKEYTRKEQECERLKYDNDYEVGALEKTIDNLKAQLLDQEAETLKAGGIIETLTKENEQLKKQACGLRPELKYIIDKTCSKYNINAKYYHEKIVEIINNLDKYTQTLTEIKEIAEDAKTKVFVDMEEFWKQILQKISEVEDGN